MTALSASVAQYPNAQFKYKMCLKAAYIRLAVETLVMCKFKSVSMSWILFSEILFKPSIGSRIQF